MPNIKSAKKRVLVSEANYARNKQYRTAMKTAIKKADKAIAENSADKEEVVKEAVTKAGLEIVEVTYQGEWVSITARK